MPNADDQEEPIEIPPRQRGETLMLHVGERTLWYARGFEVFGGDSNGEDPIVII